MKKLNIECNSPPKILKETEDGITLDFRKLPMNFEAEFEEVNGEWEEVISYEEEE